MFASGKTSAASTGGYQISRSLRFNSADSAYLNRTPASASNRKTWTWSGWVKRGRITSGQSQTLFAAGSSPATGVQFLNGTDIIQLYDYSGAYNFRLDTTPVYRDPSAWYHIVIAMDTTQATASDRLKLYINGTQVTSFSTATYPTQNTDYQINNNVVTYIGRTGIGTIYDFDGYQTEINLIDGQALTPSSFGETNAQTGVWQPKAYSGSYGTNGFYLNFSDNSNTTAATLGKDYSGNGNNWTPNNFSVTAGAGNDSLVDSPTSYGTDTGVGGTVRGNYCVWNPLDKEVSSVFTTYANGNLDCTVTGTRAAVATISVTSGKWYWEVVPTGNTGSVNYMIGVADANTPISTRSYTGANGWAYFQSGSKFNNNSGAGYGASYTTNDVIGVALDMDAGTVTFYKNGTSQGVAYSTLSGKAIQPMVSDGSSVHTMNYTGNFGQRPFAYTAPSGFKALCTQNLPTPTIGATTATQANTFFTPNLWTGNDGLQTVTNNIDTTNGGGWIWFKGRNLAVSNFLINSNSGYTKFLASNTTAAEDTYNFGFTPSTTGFSFNSGSGSVNQAGYTYVAWQWKAGGTAVSNTAGSITSTVSANTTSGFSVVTWTGNATDNASVGHGLGVAPKMVIIKNRSTSAGWPVYTNVIDGSMDALYLNLTDSKADTGRNQFTSSVFYVSSGTDTNGSGNSLVAYCFAPVAGYSAFGSYTGNGSADGPFVYTGFRPAFVLTKRTDSTSDWQLMDSSRNTYNVANTALFPNTADADTSGYSKDFLSNGFKIRDSGASLNASGGTYIYMAFASNPFKFALAR